MSAVEDRRLLKFEQFCWNVTVNLRLLTFVKAKLLTFPGRAAPVWGRTFQDAPPRCAPDAGSEASGSGAQRTDAGAQRTAACGPSCRVAPPRVLVRTGRAQQVPVLPHPVAVAPDVNDVAVMRETVDERRDRNGQVFA